MDRIVLAASDGSFGTVFCAEEPNGFFGPLPPLRPDLREIYDRLVGSGAKAEPYVAPPAPPRAALGSALRGALKASNQDASWQAALAGQSQDTRDWWTSGYRDLIPMDAKKLVRIAAAASPPVDLAALFDAADA